MRPRWALVIYFFAVAVGAVLFTPWRYRFFQANPDIFPGVTDRPFGFFIINSILFIALIGSWLLFRCQGANSFRNAVLVNPWTERNKIIGGFLFGVVSLSVVAIMSLLMGVRELAQDLNFWLIVKKLSGAMLTAWSVAIVEEILFRGAIFGAMRKEFHWKLALILSSVIYALVHFLIPARLEGEVTWLAGFQIMPQVIGGIFDWEKSIPGLLTLTFAGALLALAYQRTQNLWCSICIHAGWIFWIKSYTAFTTGQDERHNWIFGTNKMYDGWLGLIVMAGVLFVFTRLRVAREREGVA